MAPDRISRKLSEKYNDTVVEISLDGRTLNHHELYEKWNSDFYMITAANSFRRLLTEIENDKRHQLLYDLLRPEYSEILSAIGSNSDCSWVEKGWVVRTNNENELVAVAQKFEQNAIFRFSSGGKAVISCI